MIQLKKNRLSTLDKTYMNTSCQSIIDLIKEKKHLIKLSDNNIDQVSAYDDCNL